MTNNIFSPTRVGITINPASILDYGSAPSVTGFGDGSFSISSHWKARYASLDIKHFNSSGQQTAVQGYDVDYYYLSPVAWLNTELVALEGFNKDRHLLLSELTGAYYLSGGHFSIYDSNDKITNDRVRFFQNANQSENLNPIKLGTQYSNFTVAPTAEGGFI